MAMESPATLPESPMEQDEAAFPCKGCGEILEEGKAFELAGNRWHIDCFRCNTCGTLLDSDANLLLLGDGSLICNNCTYSCSNCGNKIEDLAILTGDQAFCANCFKCRNCKNKIENLRYARTSQGIFCMECHESLMARRRKKTARNAAQRQKSSNSGVKLDKSLPSLPPSIAPKSAFSPDVDTPGSETYSDTPTEVPSRTHLGEQSLLSRDRRDASPAGSHNNAKASDTLTLPARTYKNNRHSTISHKSDLSDSGEFLIPVAFDPTPPAAQSPYVAAQSARPLPSEERSRDYFSQKSSSRKPLADRVEASPRPDQSSQLSQTASPHIAYQEKNRRPSSDVAEAARKRREGNLSASNSIAPSPNIGVDRMRQQPIESPKVSQDAKDNAGNGPFRLQEVPKAKKSGGSSRNSRSDAMSPKSEDPPRATTPQQTQPRDPFVDSIVDSHKPGTSTTDAKESPRPSHEVRPRENGSLDSSRPLASPKTLTAQYPPKRGDSLETAKSPPAVPPRKDIAQRSAQGSGESSLEGQPSATLTRPSDILTSSIKQNGGKVISPPTESPTSKSIFDSAQIRARPDPVTGAQKESFTAPRAPPPPPPFDPGRARNESVSTNQSEVLRNGEHPGSPSLPRWSHGGEFSLDEDMARILGGDAKDQDSFLRRVSNSVRHGRSFSDKGMRLSKDHHRGPRSPTHGSANGSISMQIGQDISSPSTASPEHRDELSWFKNELRRERQKAVERDQRIAELEATLESTANVKQINSELREKRSTIVVLDTQKEIVVRELEVLTEHIAAAKKSGDVLDLSKLKSTVLREFADELQKLKDSFSPQIEDSIQKRNDLMEEVSSLTQMKEKSFQEFEQLSLKNAQLADLNNQLVHQIQQLYKANSTSNQEQVQPKPSPAPNGLGIYSHHKEKSQVSLESRETRPTMTDMSLPGSNTTIQQGEAEPVTVLQGPHVVNIRKDQPKKFNWTKGGKNVAKGVTKGLKGAFSSGQQGYAREMQFAETTPYGSTPPGQEYGSLPRNQAEPLRQGFGFFSSAQKGQKGGPQYKQQSNDSSSALVDASTALFGSDLEQRADFERASIPSIVVRCVQEVESRGKPPLSFRMDVEGVYRKSGGNSQVTMVKEAFETNDPTFDLSDPDLDIHAVTSGLKQYFRKLPMPLITYDVYDTLLDATSIIDVDEKVRYMRRAVLDLPKAHRDVLEFLVFHLDRVIQHVQDNMMTSQNIAVVFAPTIMRPESLAREMTDTIQKNLAVQFLVENCKGIFMH